MDKQIYTLGGAAWINLINTAYVSNKRKIDILDNSATTLHWLVENELLSETDSLAFAKEESSDLIISDLQFMRELSKSMLYDLEQQGSLSQDTTEQFNNLIKQVDVKLTLDLGSNKLKVVAKGLTTRDHVLYQIIQSIIQTIETTAVSRIRKCEHAECQLHFVDTSKSGRRRWCSMELCGNRQKAADFYARNKKKRK
ncbi:Conserved protein containing a Zn-ribbon-like motif, possibly RNA-binding [Amphibacillus marinus]|uniref:Conserved protein containing a Zn-ribbon-like motif, possibly RNA-binding n=1 Tax=Amphibacillus marinus TaxID=872970 RepID=A0A1H8KLI5_9BACI|nr:CGNR zinc finger domain-containing protein [Amphibacillus marinus]SEN93782.1 Conserved protein containing a Zn-ribbon-like motif, possibly RNA-binding [Amphibacillus marinus]